MAAELQAKKSAEAQKLSQGESEIKHQSVAEPPHVQKELEEPTRKIKKLNLGSRQVQHTVSNLNLSSTQQDQSQTLKSQRISKIAKLAQNLKSKGSNFDISAKIRTLK